MHFLSDMRGAQVNLQAAGMIVYIESNFCLELALQQEEEVYVRRSLILRRPAGVNWSSAVCNLRAFSDA